MCLIILQNNRNIPFVNINKMNFSNLIHSIIKQYQNIFVNFFNEKEKTRNCRLSLTS